MLNRQKAVLALLEQAGGSATRLTLTKWSFLLSQEAPNRGGNAFYGFVPYSYGPYSFSLHREVGSMVRDGLVEEPDGNTWRLSHAAYRMDPGLPPPLRSDVSFVIDEYGGQSGDQLLNSVYRRYPWFTVGKGPERGTLGRLGVVGVGGPLKHPEEVGDVPIPVVDGYLQSPLGGLSEEPLQEPVYLLGVRVADPGCIHCGVLPG